MTARSHPSDSVSISRAALRRLGIALGTSIALVIIVVVAAELVRSIGSTDSLASAINPNEYQAVFLANGQVYFGKLTAPGGDFYYLRHVYYLASQVSPQSGRTPQQTLIKLGNEIHGPEDLMVISRSQILFVENLKRPGKVTQAILHAGGS